MTEAMRLVYEMAVRNCAKHMKSKEEPRLNAFEFSSYLTISFNLPREITIEDLMEATRNIDN